MLGGKPFNSIRESALNKEIHRLCNLSSNGLFKETLVQASQALQKFSSSTELHIICGDANIALKQYDAGIKNYRTAIELSPGFAVPHFNLGVAFQDKGDFKSAIKSYKKAIILKPEYSESYFNIGMIQKKNGDLESAAKNFKQATNYKPNFAEAYLNMGFTYKKKLETGPQLVEDLVVAVNSFKKVLTFMPQNLQAYNSISSLLRYYIFCRRNKLMSCLDKIEDLVKLEQRKLRAKVTKYSLWHVDVPKTSTTAINVLLGEKYGWPYGRNEYINASGKPIQQVSRSILFPDHTPAFIAKSHIGHKLWGDIETFAVSRNPYSWCASLWFHTQKNKGLGLQVDTFDNFLCCFERNLQSDFTKRFIFPTYYKQTDYILDTYDKLLVKHLFKLEDRTLIDEFLQSKGVLGYGETHLRRFGNETQSADYKLTKSQMKRVEIIFKKDFEVLGY